MGYSSLARCVLMSPNKTSPRTGTISRITIHHMAGNLSAERCGQIFQNNSRQASSNYGIGSDGVIGVYVDEADRAWTSSSGANDNIAVTIEVANSINCDPWTCSDQAMASLILLCADICKRNGIPELRYTGDLSGNMTLHKWFAATACPGPFLESMMPTIASEVNKVLKSGATTYTWQSATIVGTVGRFASGSPMNVSTLSMTAGSGPATLYIDPKEFQPYIVYVDRNTTDVDYEDLAKRQVSGMMFEAGYLFTTNHMRVSKFRNPNLRKQVEKCNEAGLRFALHMIVRSRSVEEAKEECKQLYFTVSKYPPGYGLWLQLEFPGSQPKSKNHNILDYYIEQLERWGLAQGSGLYCTKEQLELIDWDAYQDKLLLWYRCMLNSEEEFKYLQSIIYPEFFQLEPLGPVNLPAIQPTPAPWNKGPLDLSGIQQVSGLNTTGFTAIGTAATTGTAIPAAMSSRIALAGNNVGEQMVNYAQQFLGAPYKYGGTSFQTGIDCSAFTQAIHAYFGISIPLTSSSQQNGGKDVGWLNNALPGDIICYDGHVALYMGNDTIIHASNPDDGVKITTPAMYRPIKAIRRYF